MSTETLEMKKPSKKSTRKITKKEMNQAPPKGATVLNFEVTTREDIAGALEQAKQIRAESVNVTFPAPETEAEADFKAIQAPVKPAKTPKAAKAAPKPPPVAADIASLDEFIAEHLEAQEGKNKVPTLEIAQRYLAAAGKDALP